MNLKTAIVFFRAEAQHLHPYPIKYRKISDENKFKMFVEKKYPLAAYANVYDRETKKYLHRIRLN